MSDSRAVAATIVFALMVSVIVVPRPVCAAEDLLRVPGDAVVTRGDFLRAALRATGNEAERTEGVVLPYARVPDAFKSSVAAAHGRRALEPFGQDLQLSRGITRGQALFVLMMLSGVKPSSKRSFYADVSRGSLFEPAVMTAIEQHWMTPLTDRVFGTNRMLLGEDGNLLLRKVRGDDVEQGVRESVPDVGIPVQKIRINITSTRTPLPKSDILESIWQLINQEFLYEEKINPEDAAYKAAEGVLESLGDPYTTFLRPVRSKSFQTQLRGQVTGIGAQVEQVNGVLTIVSPLRGSPAEAAGLKSGDQILKVNGVDLSGMGFLEAVELVRGPQGSTAELLIRREGAEMKISVVRDAIKVPEIEISLQSEIPIVHLLQFGQVTQLDLRNEISTIQRSNPKGFILDLRNNPGGLLDVATVVASNFLPSGSVVAKIKSRMSEREQRTISEPTLALSVPMVVLVNEGSASASEIVAGALQDHDRATIIGEKTFGKGTVQQVIQFNDQSSAKLTVAEWFTPSGRKIDGSGITPDIVVEENGRDEQLLEALKVLRR